MRRVLLALAIWAVFVAWHFPYAVDGHVDREAEIKYFYDELYGEDYSQANVEPGALEGMPERQAQIRAFLERVVERYELHAAKALDVGSGTGYLQDVVADYTGLDIATAAAKHYHKPFVNGTATAMPFEDASFDLLWSVWMLEHIPNPEAALSEMRRVVKPGGTLVLLPAWNVPPWLAPGYQVRPYSDLTLWGKAQKLTLPIRERRLLFWWHAIPIRAARMAVGSFGPTRLHYRRLEGSFDRMWVADSDAVSSIDATEAALWYESRGDTCITCGSTWTRLWRPEYPVLIRRQ